MSAPSVLDEEEFVLDMHVVEAHSRVRGLPRPPRPGQALNGLLAASGLNAGPLPPPLQEAFTNATTTAATALASSAHYFHSGR
ncbi:MAG: hypothetical protein ACRDSL_23915 [Pseudonocardiaceae bacterium]